MDGVPAANEKYLVVYAKLAIDKENICLHGIYYGGMADTRDEAELIAKDCINTIKGGTILPRIAPFTNNFIDIAYNITDRLTQIAQEMKEMNEMLMKSNKKK